MNQFFLTLILIIYSISSVYSQILRIVESEKQTPLEYVTLISKNPKAFATTNTEGEVDISAFKGANKIEIRRLGYQTLYKSYADLENLTFRISMTVSPLLFDGVVISATRWSQSMDRVPNKITTLSAKEISFFNPQTAADMLGSTGEVFIQKSQLGGGSPMIRGFSANRLLYAVDGIRMNTAIFRSGNLHNVISLDVFTLEQAEVLFGPGSILYGSDALGGVMSFQTLNPQFSTNEKLLIKGSATSRYSSANQEKTQHIHLNIAGRKWSSLSSFTFSDFEDLKMGRFGREEYLRNQFVARINGADEIIENPNPRIQTPSGYSQINLMQKLKFRPSEKWNFTYAFHYSATSEFSRYDRLLETQSNGLPVFAKWNYGPQIWMMNNITINYKSPNKFFDNASFKLAQQFFEESRIDRRLNNNRLRTQTEQVLAYSANFDFEKKIGKNHFYYGVEWVFNKVKSRAEAINIVTQNPILVPDRYPDSKWSSYALYLNYQHVFDQYWILQSGVRVNAFDLLSDFTRQLEFFPFDFTKTRSKNQSLTGSLGLVCSPSSDWRITGNLSTGFRAPNVDDIGKIFEFVAGQTVVPNTNLRSEYTYNGELNISKIFSEVLKFDITGFYTYLDNAMVRRPFAVNGQDSIEFGGEKSKVFAIQNAAFGRVYGFNAGIEIKPFNGLCIESRYNYQIGKEEMDDGTISRSRHAAPAFGITRFTYYQEKFKVQLYTLYSAQVSFENLNEEERQKPAIYAKDENGNPFSPGWYTVNLKAQYQLFKNLSSSAGVENITDQRYRPYSSGLVAPGRNFIIALNAKF